jgi:hypothetical protein
VRNTAFGVGQAKTVAVAGIVETKAAVVVAAAGIGGSKATAVDDFEVKGHVDTGNTGREQCFVVQRAVAVVRGDYGHVGIRCAEVDQQVVGYTGLLTDMAVLEKKGYESDHPGGRYTVNSEWMVQMVHPLADLSVIMSTPVKALINGWDYLRSLFCPAP